MGILKSVKLTGIRVVIAAVVIMAIFMASTLTAYATSEEFSESGRGVGTVDPVVEYREEKIEEIPYKTLYKYSSDLAWGESVVSVKGENGIKKVVGKVITEGGKIVDRSELSVTVIQKPVDEIILIGSLGALPATSYTFDGEPSFINPVYDKSVYVSLPEESKGTKSGQEIVGFALQYLGSPYVWGGTSLTGGCDCSGFVYSVYNACGYEMPRNDMEYVYPISVDEMLPGDIIAYPHHYSIYIGGGMEISALNSRDGVCITPVGAVASYYKAVRVVSE